MGYTGGKVADMVDRVREGAKLGGRKMADAGGEATVRHTKMNTPIGEPQPGSTRSADPFIHLRDEIFKKEVTYAPSGEGMAWESGAFTEVYYAPFVEEGTGLWGPEHQKYKIEPKTPGGVLAFFARMTTPEGSPLLSGNPNANLVHGQMVFARYVMHPGSPGQHMFAIGVQMAEMELPAVGAEGLRVWKEYSEALA